LEKRKSKALVLFNNGHKKLISLESFATIGQVSNSGYKKRNKKFKAGDSRKSGIRPHVRGVVMNPIDHPHGGGKGKKSPPSSIYNFVRLLPKNRKTTFKKNHF
jgi:ribosomal protein L2